MTETKLSDSPLQPATEKTLAPQRTESRQATTQTSGKMNEPSVEEISALAYQLWIERGSPHGSHDEDWYNAETQLLNQTPMSKKAGA